MGREYLKNINVESEAIKGLMEIKDTGIDVA